VSFAKSLRVMFVCAFLEFGALAGVPMRPEEIARLMRLMNAPVVAHVLPTEDDLGDDPPAPGDTIESGKDER
jgi:hypothetical protein